MIKTTVLENHLIGLNDKKENLSEFGEVYSLISTKKPLSIFKMEEFRPSYRYFLHM